MVPLLLRMPFRTEDRLFLDINMNCSFKMVITQTTYAEYVGSDMSFLAVMQRVNHAQKAIGSTIVLGSTRRLVVNIVHYHVR